LITGRRGRVESAEAEEGRGERASRSISCNSSYVNKSGSEELLYGLKSSKIGFWCCSSRIISNVSIDQPLNGLSAGMGRKRKM